MKYAEIIDKLKECVASGDGAYCRAVADAFDISRRIQTEDLGKTLKIKRNAGEPNEYEIANFGTFTYHEASKIQNFAFICHSLVMNGQTTIV